MAESLKKLCWTLDNCHSAAIGSPFTVIYRNLSDTSVDRYNIISCCISIIVSLHIAHLQPRIPHVRSLASTITAGHLSEVPTCELFLEIQSSRRHSLGHRGRFMLFQLKKKHQASPRQQKSTHLVHHCRVNSHESMRMAWKQKLDGLWTSMRCQGAFVLCNVEISRQVAEVIELWQAEFVQFIQQLCLCQMTWQVTDHQSGGFTIAFGLRSGPLLVFGFRSPAIRHGRYRRDGAAIAVQLEGWGTDGRWLWGGSWSRPRSTGDWGKLRIGGQ